MWLNIIIILYLLQTASAAIENAYGLYQWDGWSGYDLDIKPK